MSDKDQLIAHLSKELAPTLEARGFVGQQGHFVRATQHVTQVVELQHSIYGARMTVNFGLDLAWLEPCASWIPRPPIGPNAHDCVRWIRLGELLPEKRDRWWTCDTPEARDLASAGLAEGVLAHGLPWLERESDRARFLEHAKERLERSISPRRPEGRFQELRLYTAVLAWNDRFDDAQRVLEDCRRTWAIERAHLEEARRLYVERVGDENAPSLPDLLGALAQLISPTKGVFAFSS